MSTRIQAIRRPALRPEDLANDRKIYTTKMLGIVEKPKLIRILAKNAMITEAQAKAAIECIGPTVADLAGLGHGVQLPGLGTIRPVMKGLLNKENRPIDTEGTLIAAPAIKFSMIFEKEMTFRGNLETDVEYSDFDYRQPRIIEVRDGTSGELNKQVTVGGMIGMKGENLRFNPTKSDEGVWFIPLNGVEEDNVKVSSFLDNRPARLTFTAPIGLVTGSMYRMEIRNRFGGSNLLRTSNYLPIITAL